MIRYPLLVVSEGTSPLSYRTLTQQFLTAGAALIAVFFKTDAVILDKYVLLLLNKETCGTNCY